MRAGFACAVAGQDLCRGGGGDLREFGSREEEVIGTRGFSGTSLGRGGPLVTADYSSQLSVFVVPIASFNNQPFCPLCLLDFLLKVKDKG